MEKQSNTKESKTNKQVWLSQRRKGCLQEAQQGKGGGFSFLIKLVYHCFTTYISFCCTTTWISSMHT